MKRLQHGLLALFAFSLPAFAVEPPPLRVKLDVMGDDADKVIVTSYITTALRALHSVVVADENPDFRLVCIVGRTGMLTSKSGPEMTIAATVTSFVPSKGLTKWLEAKRLTSEDMEQVRETLESLTQIEGFYTQAGGFKELEEACKKMVASADGAAFEKERLRRQAADDLQRGAIPGR